MKKRVLIPLLIACLLAALLPASALAATASNITYYDWNSSTKTMEEKTCSTATVVSSSDNTWGNDGNGGWYVVNSNVTITSRISVSGEVHLILADGCTLTAQKGIRVEDDDDDITNGSPNALTIYGQTKDNGKLNITQLYSSKSAHAAIGSNEATESTPAKRSGTVTINGGIINARSYNGAGIGGGAGKIRTGPYEGGACGTVIINGGTVTATSTYTSGIGGGRGYTEYTGDRINGFIYHRGGDGGNVIIRGGIVTATGTDTLKTGIGGGVGSAVSTMWQDDYETYSGAPGTFTTDGGNAVIFASSIQDQSDKANWHGVIFEGDTGKVYGGTVTPCGGFTIGSGKKLTIDSGMTLVNNHIILVEGSVINNGTVRNPGKIYVDGTFTGTADNLYYPLTLTDATANNNTSNYNSKTYGKAGSKITLTPDAPPQQGMEHSGWDVNPATVQISNNEFTMPKSATQIGARFGSISYTVKFSTAGGSAIADKAVYWDDAVLDGVANPTRGGWTFTGWMCGDKAVTAQTKYSELAADDTVKGITLTAQWTNKDYSVTFDTAGGSAIADKAVHWDDAVLDGVANPTRSGWTFTGWMCGDKAVTAQTKYSELAAEDTVKGITLTAQWTNKDYSVTFDTAGGSAIADKAVHWDDAVLDGVANPTRSGWTFTGWMCGDKAVTAQTKYSELAAEDTVKGITLTAQWSDSTAPVMIGIEDGEVYCSAPTMTVTDNKGIASVTVNGTQVSLGSSGEFTLSATNSAQTIVATDAEGNRTEVTVTVNDGHRGGEASCVNQAVCIYCGEAYGEVDSTKHVHLEHAPARDATVTETGNIEYWYCTDCRRFFADADGKNVITQEDTITPKLPPEIIDGMGQSILAGEEKALSFTSNALFADYIRVELDGTPLPALYYTVREGSTIVTLKAEYVATLAVGEHTIGVVSENGTAETTFSVNPQLPQTGDNSRITLWMALLLISGGLLTAACIRKRSAR